VEVKKEKQQKIARSEKGDEVVVGKMGRLSLGMMMQMEEEGEEEEEGGMGMGKKISLAGQALVGVQ